MEAEIKDNFPVMSGKMEDKNRIFERERSSKEI